MSINNLPPQVIMVPVPMKTGKNEHAPKGKGKRENKTNEQSADRFAKRTLLASKTGAVLGAISAPLALAAFKGVDTLAKAKTAIKTPRAAAIVALVGLAGAAYNALSFAGLYNMASSARKSFNKKSNEFDKQQIKQTVKEGSFGAAVAGSIGAASNFINKRPVPKAIAPAMFELATLQTGLSSIITAKKIKAAQKEKAELD